ncbi:MAG: hypothetical protein ACI8WM_001237 [Burkholderiaceae bacterium]|jgi:hypothetical protein
MKTPPGPASRPEAGATLQRMRRDSTVVALVVAPDGPHASAVIYSLL